MDARILKVKRPLRAITKDLDSIFMKDGMIIPVDVKDVDRFPEEEIRYYCHLRGIYNIVTTELVNFLDSFLPKEQSKIEIGAGNGTLSRALKIPATDNKMQLWPHIKASYRLMGQPTINYPEFIEQIDAIEAIKKYKPNYVLGAWITHRYRANEHYLGGNQYAPDEEEIMRLCDNYLLIGNLNTHGRNRLFNGDKYRRAIIKKDFLRSRSQDRDLDAIFIFEKK